MKKRIVRVLLAVLVILALIAGGGFCYLYWNGLSGLRNDPQPQAGQIRVACVGDSTTYGHGIRNWPRNHYPKRLQTLLGKGYHVGNFGASGYAVQSTADRPYTEQKKYQQSLSYEGDFVVFMMGANDSKPENWQNPAAFKQELEARLDSYSGSHLILCTPTAAFFMDGQTEGMTNHHIQPLVVAEIAQIVREVSAERGYPLVDIYTLTASHPEWFAKDGVHPSGEGAHAIAQAVYTGLAGLT